MRQLSAHQRACLTGMGVPVWRERDATALLEQPDSVAELADSGLQAQTPPSASIASAVVSTPAPAAPPKSPRPARPLSDFVPQAIPELSELPTLEALQACVSECRQCALSESRTKTVFGSGTDKPRVLLIGEAPGRDEDLQAEPFVGRAGQLLTKMLLAIGLQREQIYITNILKCRPPNNRDPHIQEMKACEGFLLRQIELLQPDVLLAAGRVSAQSLLRCQTPVGQLRGLWHQHKASGLPLLVTYHPAYLLRNPKDKAKSWEDLQRLNGFLGQQ